MSSIVRLALVFHNHQPIGNFDGVIEQAYQDSYLPFLDVFEKYDRIKISLHTSGPLMLWLAERHPEYLERLRLLVANERIEILGGPFYEPILTMLPSRDRIGQIQKYTEWLTKCFSGTKINGMWTPERVWESQLVRDIVPAGIHYTIVDDYHFRSAGFNSDQLTNYFYTEDDGHVLRVFPGNEQLRYLIPFAAPHETVEYCRKFARQHPGGSLVFGDDGEKFGTWPNTKAHVYEQGWLHRFFQLLTENSDWLITCGPSEIIRQSPPVGRAFLPDCSYREMTEWALPVDQHIAYEEITHELQNDSRWEVLSRFVKGGVWRNFRTKYSEANEMYCRMLEVSRALDRARKSDGDPGLLPQIEDHLYRGQCNCPYWHGAFGGIYLPHLRNATYREFIAADNLLERINGRVGSYIHSVSEDFDKDLYPEVRMSNEQLIAYVAPFRGGMLYELDMREAQHNLLATMQRRPESYHKKILAATSSTGDGAASIHNRIVFKQEGLSQRLQYDNHARKSMIDHFWDNDLSFESLVGNHAMERGDFVGKPYEAKIRRSDRSVELVMKCDGNAWGIPLTLTKSLLMTAGSDCMKVNYLIEGLPQDEHLHFASEWNWAGMPSGANDRFFFDEVGAHMGDLGSKLDLYDMQHLGLIDQWLGVSVQIHFNRPTSIWAFPIATVSQSEGGFEMVHQSVCVMPHWLVRGDSDGLWSCSMDITISKEHQVKPRKRVAAPHFHDMAATPVLRF